jgi:D-lactate dehydrogenase
MKVSFFDTHRFEKEAFTQGCTNDSLSLQYFSHPLNVDTAPLCHDSGAVCAFVNDVLDENCLSQLAQNGVGLVALRCAGFNNVDIATATRLGIQVCRVPAYSPHAVAEYALGMILTLNRKIHRAFNRVRELNFSLDGLVGFNLHGKVVGCVGCGKIGKVFCQLMAAFGCRVLVYDKHPDPDLQQHKQIEFVGLQELCRKSDLISLHIPLTPETHHLLDRSQFQQMKKGVFIVNTGRGALINTQALVEALKSQKVGAAALDVYEEEENVFFHDLSGQILQDDQLARLLTFPNVLITSHQAFLTTEALQEIASTTLNNLQRFAQQEPIPEEYLVTMDHLQI